MMRVGFVNMRASLLLVSLAVTACEQDRRCFQQLMRQCKEGDNSSCAVLANRSMCSSGYCYDTLCDYAVGKKK